MKILLNGLELIGAYGRKTSMEDWHNGLDFKIVGGPYCSDRDVPAMIDDGVQILEFTQDGELVERIILDPELFALTENVSGDFNRLS